jgi:hypothetical protein
MVQFPHHVPCAAFQHRFLGCGALCLAVSRCRRTPWDLWVDFRSSVFTVLELARAVIFKPYGPKLILIFYRWWYPGRPPPRGTVGPCYETPSRLIALRRSTRLKAKGVDSDAYWRPGELGDTVWGEKSYLTTIIVHYELNDHGMGALGVPKHFDGDRLVVKNGGETQGEVRGSGPFSSDVVNSRQHPRREDGMHID